MQLALLFLLLVHTADLWWMFQRFNPFVPKVFVYPPAPVVDFLKEQGGSDRFWGYGNAAIGTNMATQLRLYSPDGYDPLYPKWYGEFISASIDGSIHTQFTSTTRSDAMIVPGFGEEDLPNNTNRLRVLDALGVRFILDRAENANTLKTFPADRFRLIYERDGWKVFENLKAAPRAFIASGIEIYTNEHDFAERFFSPSFNPSKNVLFDESSQIKGFQTAGGNAEIVSYLPQEVIVKTETPSDSVLFLSDTYYPDWKAFVDNTETAVYKANWAFRGVFVPQGIHKVAFRYEPSSFALGKRISLVSLLVSLVTLMIVSKRRYENS